MDARFPVGDYVAPKEVTPALRQAAMEETAALPANRTYDQALRGIHLGQARRRTKRAP
jgi:hypothetical protein